MATSDFAILTVENTGGALALKRKNAAEVVPETASPVYGSVTGNPAVIPDAAGERVMRSVRVSIEAVQAGSGDPAPDNVRPISGWTGAQIARHGKNLIDFDAGAYTTTLYPYEASGSFYIRKSSGSYSVVIPCEPNTTYTLSKRSGTRCRAAWTTAVPAEDMECFGMVNESTAAHIDVATGEDAAYLIFYFWYSADTCTKEEMLATVWIEYAGVPEFIDVEFPTEAGTVYGGVLDLTAGTLTVTHIMVEFGADTSRLNWGVSASGIAYVSLNPTATVLKGAINGVISDQYTHVLASVANKVIRLISNVVIYDNERFPDQVTAFASLAANPVHVVCPLMEPVVYQLTPVQIAALAGDNAFWADCGPVSVEYVRDTGAAIEAGDADTRAMIGEASGKTASRSLAVGEYVTVGDKLYRVTSAIGSGETLVPGSNVTETTVGEELTALFNLINA